MNAMKALKSLFPSRSVMSPLMAVACNVVLAFLLFSAARLEFVLLNRSFFSDTIAEGRLWNIMKAGLIFDPAGIFYINALYIVLMLLPLHLKERPGWYRMCRWLFVVVNSLALIANLADSVYFPFTLRRTTWSVFSEFGNESNVASIVGVELLRHWYLVLLAALLIAAMWKLYVSPAMVIARQSLPRYYLLSLLSLAVAGVTVVAGIRGGLLNHWYNYIAAFPLLYIGWRLLNRPPSPALRRAGWLCSAAGVALVATAPIGGFTHKDIRPLALSNANAHVARPIETAAVLNTPFSLFRTMGHPPFSDPHYFDNRQLLAGIYSPLHNPAPASGPKRKNVVILIMESFATEYIGQLARRIVPADSVGYTPFTDSLLSSCAWWSHSFDNGGKSIDGIPSVLAGIPMFVTPFVVTPQAVNKIEGLPAMLGKWGYESAFFHGARTGSMGFDAIARSIGFRNYFGREDFESDPRFGSTEDFDGYWGIWDEPFLQYFATKMSDLRQPFVTAVFTLSNHHPFRVPEKYKDKFPAGSMEIHPTVGYADFALQRFFETARKQPWFGNTIFVIVNDHTNMRGYDEFRSDIGIFYGPVLIYDPSGEVAPGMREGIVQQTDIMPTILGILGYDRPFLAFGCDALTTPPEQTWAVNFTNNLYQYVKYGYVMQFDGEKVRAIYSISDHLMAHDIKDSCPERDRMERELKAIIQQYMDRMIHDRLTAN